MVSLSIKVYHFFSINIRASMNKKSILLFIRYFEVLISDNSSRYGSHGKYYNISTDLRDIVRLSLQPVVKLAFVFSRCSLDFESTISTTSFIFFLTN